MHHTEDIFGIERRILAESSVLSENKWSRTGKQDADRISTALEYWFSHILRPSERDHAMRPSERLDRTLPQKRRRKSGLFRVLLPPSEQSILPGLCQSAPRSAKTDDSIQRHQGRVFTMILQVFFSLQIYFRAVFVTFRGVVFLIPTPRQTEKRWTWMAFFLLLKWQLSPKFEAGWVCSKTWTSTETWTSTLRNNQCLLDAVVLAETLKWTKSDCCRKTVTNMWQSESRKKNHF